jgi:hypothetical protein
MSEIEQLYREHLGCASHDCEKTTANEQGGVSSPTTADYTLLPARAVDMVTLLMTDALQKYDRDNWRLIDAHDHINHCVRHLMMFQRTGSTDDLTRATCRAMMALEMQTTYLNTNYLFRDDSAESQSHYKTATSPAEYQKHQDEWLEQLF